MLIPFHDDNPIRRLPFVTVGLIVVNTLLLLYTSGLDPDQEELFYKRHGFVPARIEQLIDSSKVIRLELGAGDVAPEFEPRPDPSGTLRYLELEPLPAEIMFSLISCMFLHGGIMHLVGNMWFFWIFGNNIEDRLGHLPFLCFYLLGGLVASATHWLMTSVDQSLTPVVGASGAVAVMLGAYAVTYPHARVRCLVLVFLIFFIELPALVVLGFWIVGQLISASGALAVDLNGGVAWWAHVGGFLAGALVMPLLTWIIPQQETAARYFRPPPGSPDRSRALDPATRWSTDRVGHNDPPLRKHDNGIRWEDE